jgi:hypothetical protein
MFGRKRIKELEEKVDLLKEKLVNSNNEITSVRAANYKYKHLFSEMFNRLSISNVVKYKVTKDLTNINDEKTLFCVKYDDGRSFVYEINLVSTEYEEDLNGNNG